MHIAITGSATRRCRKCRVGHINEDQPPTAGKIVTISHSFVTADRPSSNGIAKFLVDHDVVRPSDRQLGEVASEVFLGEQSRVGWVQVEKLIHIKDLHAVLDCLRPDDDQVAQGPDLSPPRANGVILWQSPKIQELSLRGDFCKGSPIVLANCDKLSPVLGRPPP